MNHLTKKTTISDLRKWSKNGETRKYGKSEGAFTSAVHRGNFTLGIWEIGREKKKIPSEDGAPAEISTTSFSSLHCGLQTPLWSTQFHYYPFSCPSGGSRVGSRVPEEVVGDGEAEDDGGFLDERKSIS